MGTVQKGKALRGDLNTYDGTLAKSRVSSSGGTTNGLAVNDYVDALEIFGASDTSNMTDATITNALNALGAKNIAVMFAPGIWTVSNTISVPANITVICPAGCVFDIASAKTMTVAGVFLRQHATYKSGSGTLTISGTDSLLPNVTTSHYAVDTGSADNYVIDVGDNPLTYVDGAMYAFKALSANTGSSQINVDSLGAKAILKYDKDGTLDVLELGDILSGQITQVRYDGTQFQLIPNRQFPLSYVATSSKNVFTATQVWMKGADVASATELLVGIAGNSFDVTGTTTITSFATKGVGCWIALQFDGALTLTHHATNLILPGGASITTAAGDTAIFLEVVAGQWRCISYQDASSGIYDAANVAITGGSITGITDIVVADGGTGVSTLTDGGILLGSGTGAITATAVLADGEFIVGDGTTDPVLESGDTARISLGVGSSDSPTFAGLTLTADLTVANGGTGASSFTDGGVLVGSGTGAVTALAVMADGEMIVGDGTTDPVLESGATLRTSLGLGTGDSPQFTGIELGHATDSTITRVSAGVLAIEGDNIITTSTQSGSFSTGDVKLTYKTAADSTWVLADDGSIGSAASSATNRANADTEDLYKLLYDNMSDAECPVATGRGASASADFAANKALTIPLTLGRALGISGSGASLTARTLGDTVGEEAHVQVESELAAHRHTYGNSSQSIAEAGGTAIKDAENSGSFNTTSTGGGGAANVMQPTTFLNIMIKL